MKISIHGCFSWFWKATAIFWQKILLYQNIAILLYLFIAILLVKIARLTRALKLNIFFTFGIRYRTCFLFRVRLRSPGTPPSRWRRWRRGRGRLECRTWKQVRFINIPANPCSLLFFNVLHVQLTTLSKYCQGYLSFESLVDDFWDASLRKMVKQINIYFCYLGLRSWRRRWCRRWTRRLPPRRTLNARGIRRSRRQGSIQLETILMFKTALGTC